VKKWKGYTKNISNHQDIGNKSSEDKDMKNESHK
jgi:hypothetical protein